MDHISVGSNQSTGCSEITTDLYGNCVHLYWEGCVYIFKVIQGTLLNKFGSVFKDNAVSPTGSRFIPKI